VSGEKNGSFDEIKGISAEIIVQNGEISLNITSKRKKA
jgi:hypothetical protein